MNKIRTRVKNLYNIMLFFIRRNSVKLKVLVSYIIIGSLLIAFLSTFLYMKFSDNSIKEIYNVSVNSLEQTVRAFDTLWAYTFINMNKEFQTNSTLIDAMFMKEFDPVDSGDISQKLNDILVSNNMLFYSIYIYNSEADMVFSTIGPVTNCQGFYDAGIIKEIKNSKVKLSEISDCAIIYRKMIFEYGAGLENKNAISIIFSSDNLKSAMIFNIDQNSLQNLMIPKKSDSATSILIINKEGTVISNSKLENIFENISNQGFIKRIISSEENYGYFVNNENGIKNLITFNRFEKWNNLGWIFISVGDYQKLLMNVNELHKFVLKITAIFVLLSLFIAIFSAKNIFSPLYLLLGKINAKMKVSNSKKLNEYDYLTDVYDTLVNDLDNLKSSRSYDMHVMKKELLNRIMNGEFVENSEFKKQISDLNINIDIDGKILVVVFRFDSFKILFEKYPVEDLALLRFAVCNISEEIFSEKFRVQTAESGKDNISAIINIDGADTVNIDYLTGNILSIQDNCQKYLNLSLTSGLGSVEEGAKGIQISYINAMEATNYRVVFGKQLILDYKSVISARNEEYKYPLNIERNIIDALKSADELKLDNYLAMFIEYITKYSYEEILLALSQLTIISFRTVKTMLDVDCISEVAIYYDYREFSGAINDCDTLEEKQKLLMSFYKNIINNLKQVRDIKYENIVGRIQKYVEQNYSDINLSVEGLSRMVNLSSNYVRTLFKNSAGKSLSNYINDIRFSKAKELLNSSDFPANKIAEMIGFQGSGYFYTAFKKYVGMSPDDYRKNNPMKQLK